MVLREKSQDVLEKKICLSFNTMDTIGGYDKYAVRAFSALEMLCFNVSEVSLLAQCYLQ